MKPSILTYSFLKECNKYECAFAAFSYPGETTFNLIIQKDQEHSFIKKMDEIEVFKGFVFAPFNLDNHKMIGIKNDFHFKEGESFSKFHFSGEKKTYLKSEIRETTKENYLNNFNDFKQSLNRLETDKLVLSKIKSVKKSDNFNITVWFTPKSLEHG